MDSRLLNSQTEEPSFVEELLKKSHALFSRLTIDSVAFECDEFINKLVEFLDTYKRIQYSYLSSLIYNSDEDIREKIQSNLETLVNYSQTENFDILLSEEEQNILVSKTLVKLWDHYNLAMTQMRDLTIDDFYEKFWPERNDINDTIKEEGRKIHKELIAMIAIFTAMSFLIFGGLNSLSQVLSASIGELPILNISIVCFAWSLCVYNLIYLFMYLVGKLIDARITSRSSNKFYKRHAVFLIGNLIMISGLLLTGWLYFIQSDFNNWYTKLYCVFGVYTKLLPIFFVLILLVLFFIFSIYKRVKKVIIKCYYVHKFNEPVIIEDDAVYDNEWNLLQRR